MISFLFWQQTTYITYHIWWFSHYNREALCLLVLLLNYTVSDGFLRERNAFKMALGKGTLSSSYAYA